MKLTIWSDFRIFSQFRIFEIIFNCFTNGETNGVACYSADCWRVIADTGTFNHPSYRLLFPIHYTDNPSPAQGLISHRPLECSQKGV